MRTLTRHLIPGLAALGALGAMAGAASAALPDPAPFLTDDPVAQNGTPHWYVDTSRAGGTYSALYRFPVDVKNLGAGPLEFVVKTPTDGDATARTGGALQNHDATNTDLTPSITTATTSFTGGGTFVWGVKGLIAYTLTPPGGGTPIAGAIAPTCWFDGTTYTLAQCSGDANGGGFVSGIPAASADAISIGSGATSPSLDITNITPGLGTVTATISSAIADAVTSNNTAALDLTVPGVTAAPVAATTTGTAPKAIGLSATIHAKEVLGRRLDAAGPPAPAPADDSLAYTIASDPGHGALSGLNAATGAVTYTAAAGFTGTDTFTYYAEDSRGLRSPSATVTVTVGGTAAPSPAPPGTPPARLTLKLKPSFTVVHKGKKTFLRVSGTLPTSQVGRSVKIQRKVGKRISTVGSAKIARTGRYTALIRVKSARVSLRVTIPASATAKGSTTAFKSLVVAKKS